MPIGQMCDIIWQPHHTKNIFLSRNNKTMTILIRTLAVIRDPLTEVVEFSTLPSRSNKSSEVVSKRSVRFASPQVVEYVTARSDLTVEETNNTWWSPAAMAHNMRDAKALSKEAQSSGFMVAAFEKAYEVSKVMANTSGSFDDVQVEQDLVDYCRFGHCFRGLERSSSKLYNRARYSASSHARKGVIELTKQGADKYYVRGVYERATLSSKLFAHVMGEADAVACKSRFSKRQ